MDKKKVFTAILAIIAVCCVFAMLVFSGVIDLEKLKNNGEESTEEQTASFFDDLTDKIKFTSSSSVPYLKTDIDSVFYTITADGTVNFFKYDAGVFTPVEASGKYSTSVSLSEEKIPVEITYLKQDGIICGYGLFKESENQQKLYTYAFFRLRNYGENYSGAYSTSCLLLVDTTREDLYSDNKIFEESFVFKYSDSTSTRDLRDRSRTIGLNGALRDDYFIFSDTVLDGAGKYLLFFSGRYYAESDNKIDLLRSGGTGNNKDNTRLAKDIIGYWAKSVSDGYKYITVDENDNIAVVTLSTSDKVTVNKTFEGVTRDDVIVYGDYIYIVPQNVLYSINDDTSVAIKYSDSSFTADKMVTDGETVVLLGKIKAASPVMIKASASSGDAEFVYSDELFENAANPVILNDSSVLVTAENGGLYTYYIF